MLRALRGVLGGAAVLAVAVWASYELGPSIDQRQSLPDDVALLTAETWDRFEAAFPAQAGCLTDVELELVDEVVEGTAQYLVSERLIRIEIPTSPRRYVETLTHELAHHIDATCNAEFTIGAAFREAQGIDSQTAWECVDAWESRPMEQFAETVLEYVTADRFTHADVIDVSDEALDIVRRWATNDA